MMLDNPTEYIKMKLLEKKPTHFLIAKHDYEYGKSIIGQLGYRLVKDLSAERGGQFMFFENRYLHDY